MIIIQISELINKFMLNNVTVINKYVANKQWKKVRILKEIKILC